MGLIAEVVLRDYADVKEGDRPPDVRHRRQVEAASSLVTLRPA